MIKNSWLKITLLLSMVYVRSTKTASCPQSQDTVTRIQSCPKSKEEWDLRAEAKRCSIVSQQCENNEESVYHCVLNSFADETIEVCAPSTEILGRACVEYNVRGAIIQESPYVKCNQSCPFKYRSTDVYKYQDCFKTILRNSTTNVNSNISRCTQESFRSSSEKDWMIAALVLILSNISFILWITYSEWRRRQKGSSQSNDIEERVALYGPKKSETGQNVECYTGVYVAGVYLGDSILTIALSKKEKPEDFILFGTSERMCLLFDNGKIVFGNAAFNQYTDNKSKDLRYEENLHLSEGPKNPEIYDAAITKILERLWDALDQCDGLSINTQSNVHYAFVVPTHWGKKAKENLKKEIVKKQCKNEHQNISEERLHILSRDRTLLPFIHEVNARVSCLKFNVKNLKFEEHDSYAILHIGSTCCVLRFLEVGQDKDSNSLRYEWETLSARHQVGMLLVKEYGNTVVDNWKVNHKREYIMFLNEFQMLRENWAKNAKENETYILNLPTGLALNEKKPDAVSKNTNELKITSEFLKISFKEMRDEVKKWIEKEENKFKNVKCVVITGTYSKSEMVWNEAEKEWFNEKPVTIVLPENVQVFAMGGAFYVQKKLYMEKLATEG